MDYLGTQCASKTLLSGSIESDDSQIPFRRCIHSPTNQLRKLSAALLTCRSRTKDRFLLFKLTLLRHGQHVVERKGVRTGPALSCRHARFGIPHDGLGLPSDQTCASTTSSSSINNLVEFRLRISSTYTTPGDTFLLFKNAVF
jgi:hypothetical protein